MKPPATLRTLCMIGCAVMGAASPVAAAASMQSNGLVPGIAPYAPGPATSPGAAPPATPQAYSPAIGPRATAVGPGAAASTVGPGPGTAPATTASGERAYDYVLGPGDKLRITVFGEETLSGEFTVAGNGDLSFPLVGEMKAAGVTLEALKLEIKTALQAGYVKDPRVSAEVLTFRPYYIYGEVAKPGEYPYTDRITVINAIATAGGFSYRANRHFVFIKRVTDKKEHREALTQTLGLSPGDTVRVLERYF